MHRSDSDSPISGALIARKHAQIPFPKAFGETPTCVPGCARQSRASRALTFRPSVVQAGLGPPTVRGLIRTQLPHYLRLPPNRNESPGRILTLALPRLLSVTRPARLGTETPVLDRFRCESLPVLTRLRKMNPIPAN